MAAILIFTLHHPARAAGNYKNFTVAVYVPIFITRQMDDPQWLADQWQRLCAQAKIDKVYIETYRTRQIADEQSLERIKKFFADKGVRVAAGVALHDTSYPTGEFRTFCYTDPKDRAYVKNVMEMTARHFDEIILDDFFFFNTKNDSDIAAKGNKTWTQFRLDTMDEAAENLIVKPAHAVNPRVKVVIKFPNWYEHFEGLGYDLDREPSIFDGIYTGTETRDPVQTEQHLQAYEGYLIMRYFENIRPGGNGGGWVDTYGIRYIDRYAEQLWLTAFAKPTEIMLFNFADLQRPIAQGDRSAWQGLSTSFSYDAMLHQYQQGGGADASTMARAAGYALQQVDGFLDKLGKPVGLKSYRPYHATGEDFLHNYLGMIGIPIDLCPDFPADADMLLLTESAKFDPDIVNKIKGQLSAGKSVVITSGLLRALADKGIQDICETECTDLKAAVTAFEGRGGTPIGAATLDKPLLFPQIRFLTNDAWMLVQGVANGNGYPILLMDRYSKGVLYVLAIPDNFNDLYALPPEVVGAIKNVILRDATVRLIAPGQVALFTYDNNTCIVESFLPTPTSVALSVGGGFTKLRDLVGDQVISGQPERSSNRRGETSPQRMLFTVQLQPHSYQAFAPEK
jgi:hypothetical protein